MKKTMFALAAMMVAGLASAVSTSWTAVSSDKVTGGWQAGVGPTTTASFSIATVFTVVDVNTFKATSNTILLGIANNSSPNTGGPSLYVYADGGVAGKTNSVALNFGNSGGIHAQDLGTNAYKTAYGNALKAGENALAMTVTMFANDTNQKCATYTVYLNGTKIGEATHSNIGAGVYDFKNIALYSVGAAYYMNGIATTADIASLPEPTVLALLALGVGAIALKRKVA